MVASVLFTTLTFFLLAQGAEITLGPQAYASIASQEPFSVLKPCAQGCLRYNGRYVCGMAGWGDLGSNIGCGCSPQNYCLCDKREASRASSYIQSCVVTACGTPTEESAVLDLYNGYCLTANVAVASTSTKPYSFTGSTPSASVVVVEGSQETTLPGSTARLTGAAATSASLGASSQTGGSDSSSGNESKPVLGLGAIIGIAVGGVVLLTAIGCLGCCMLYRRRRNRKNRLANASNANQGFTNVPAPLEIAYIPPPTGGAVQIDGAGAFGANGKKQEEKVNISPLSTPGVQHVVPVQGHQQQPQGTFVPTPPPTQVYTPPPQPCAHEMYGNGQFAPPPVPTGTHEMYGQGNMGYQQQQQQQYGQQMRPQEMSGGQQRVHEMYGNQGYAQHPQQQQQHVYEKP